MAQQRNGNGDAASSRAAVYCRVSTEEQSQAGTIDNQVSWAKRYAELYSLPIAGFYLDDGVSGTVPFADRPEGGRLLKDIAAGKADVVLVYKLDRLARKLRILLDTYETLDKLGVALRSMTENIDTRSAVGRLLMQLMGSFAEYERETIIERTMLGSARQAGNGKWLGGIVPYGYLVGADGHLEVSEQQLPGVDTSEADVIRMCYRLLAEEGWTCYKIADHLNALAVPPSYVKDGRSVTKGKRTQATSGNWQPSRVRNMLVQTTYKGVHQYGRRSKREGRELIERTVPAVVSAETWEAAQTALHNNRRFSSKNAKRQYLLRGLMTCGICGLTYCGTPGSRKEDAYYKCSGKTAYRGKLAGRCPSKPIRVDDIEAAVWGDITEFVRDPGRVVELVQQKLETGVANRKSVEQDVTQLETAAHAKQKERDVVIGLLRRQLITPDEGERQLSDLAREMESLRQQQAALLDQLQRQTENEGRLVQADVLLGSLRDRIDEADFDAKRALVEALVQGIRVDTIGEGPKRTVEATVTYRFDTVTRTGTPACNNPTSLTLEQSHAFGTLPGIISSH